MRRLLAVALAALGCVYAVVAFELFHQNRWAEALPAIPSAVTPDALRHPETLLALVQDRFARNRFRDEELELVKRALEELPSFYEPPYLLARFYSARLEQAEKTRAAFEVAVSRYPANGRLQLSYGSWLLESRQTLDGWRDSTRGYFDPLPDAELRLKTAMELEPDLSWRALSALSRNRVPSARWSALVPDSPIARSNLLDALFQAGEVEAVWESLENGDVPLEDPNTLRRIIHWGLQGKRPELALEAALAWQAHVERSSRIGPDAFTPALWVVRSHLALDDPESAYDALQATLERVEMTSGISNRASLEFLCAMGDEFRQRGLAATAEVLYGEAAMRSPSYVPALLGLARVLSGSGDLEGAAVRYEEVLRLDPSNLAAARELKSLLLRKNRS